jgi:hypothetical protein
MVAFRNFANARKYAGRYNSTPQHAFMVWQLINHVIFFLKSVTTVFALLSLGKQKAKLAKAGVSKKTEDFGGGCKTHKVAVCMEPPPQKKKTSKPRPNLRRGLPKITNEPVLHNEPRLHAYKIQLRHKKKDRAQPKEVKHANFT